MFDLEKGFSAVPSSTFVHVDWNRIVGRITQGVQGLNSRDYGNLVFNRRTTEDYANTYLRVVCQGL